MSRHSFEACACFPFLCCRLYGCYHIVGDFKFCILQLIIIASCVLEIFIDNSKCCTLSNWFIVTSSDAISVITLMRDNLNIHCFICCRCRDNMQSVSSVCFTLLCVTFVKICIKSRSLMFSNILGRSIPQLPSR